MRHAVLRRVDLPICLLACLRCSCMATARSMWSPTLRSWRRREPQCLPPAPAPVLPPLGLRPWPTNRCTRLPTTLPADCHRVCRHRHRLWHHPAGGHDVLLNWHQRLRAPGGWVETGWRWGGVAGKVGSGSVGSGRQAGRSSELVFYSTGTSGSGPQVRDRSEA